MRHLILIILFTVSSVIASSQVYCFEYSGKTYCLQRGTKIKLGEGSNGDKSFSSMEEEVTLRESNSFRNNSGYNSSSSKTLYTGQKAGLPASYAGKVIPVHKVKYYKKYDYYTVKVFTENGIYPIILEDAVKKKEVVAINGIEINYTPVTDSLQNNSTATMLEGALNFTPVATANTKKPSIGLFMNATDVIGGFGIDRTNSPSSKYTIGISNYSGFNFKEYFFLGGGIGYTYLKGKSFSELGFVSAGLNQRVYPLANKFISPEFSFFQHIGTRVNSDADFKGPVWNLGGSLGARVKIKHQYYLSVFGGYSVAITKYGSLNGTQYYWYWQKNSENIFFGLSFGFNSKITHNR
ncbi:MAG: hypothetical protein JNK66_06805 [Chitinophagales bacterium]|nr:hypothetical protein [Chitinophagales bacterium]